MKAKREHDPENKVIAYKLSIPAWLSPEANELLHLAINALIAQFPDDDMYA